MAKKKKKKKKTTKTNRLPAKIAKIHRKHADDFHKLIVDAVDSMRGEGMNPVLLQACFLETALNLTLAVHGDQALAHIHGQIAGQLERLEGGE